ncbi:S8 family peptidase [Rheinheimera maricola]|uniref:S8 family serine peptidase n=1 Tax=Rheinheimera maricola TaxID=2793282 RepID=A0ABS7X5E1_9GAMM|nr:S8 family serine peptidase [Rheinheimera maricola]MBZ9610766.1 S8 family serine peptidase [Rheinheimera maricola]
MSGFKLNYAVLASSLILANAVSASERLIVSIELPTNQVESLQSGNSPRGAVLPVTGLTKSETCLILPSGDNWCVPIVKEALSSSAIAAQNSANGSRYVSMKVAVPDGLSLDQAEVLLKNTGIYRHVERDVAITSMKSVVANNWNATTPLDPEFVKQHQFNRNTKTDSPIESSVFAMWQLIENPLKDVSVYVFDTGFRQHKDIVYDVGVNTTVESYDNERNGLFLEDDFDPENLCNNSHGVGVASVIGAAINEVDMAGMVNDITLTAVRVMKCGNGFLSDVAAGLDWLSDGDPFLYDVSPDLPRFTGQPGIVNMSLGGHVASGCPFYLQSAINRAINKGFILVASAGNESKDASTNMPAACEGVISVGAAQLYDGSPDIAAFSNFGASVDVMARGTSVIGLSKDDAVIGWSGTSFSAPIVAGLLALLNKDFDLTNKMVKQLVTISGVTHWAEDSQCAALGCGSGILDGVKLYQNAVLYSNGELDSASYSLNVLAPCRQQWAVDNLYQGASLCNDVRLDLLGLRNIKANEAYRVVSVPKGQGASVELSGATVIGNFTKRHAVVSKADLTDVDVYVR